MYPQMAKVAREEGFDDIANLFEGIGKIEKEHQERYKKLLTNIQAGSVYKREDKVKWRCRNCGFTHEGKNAVEKCPVCQHPQSYFELVAENY